MSLLRTYIRELLAEELYRGTSGEEVLALVMRSPIRYDKQWIEHAPWTTDLEAAKKRAHIQSPDSPFVVVADDNKRLLYALDLNMEETIDLQESHSINEQWDDDEWGEEQYTPETHIIEVGTELYHGTQSPEEFDIPNGPAWFSESQYVAEDFVKWNEWPDEKMRPRILTFNVIAPIELVSFDGEDAIEQFKEHHGVESGGIRDLADAVCEAGFNGWIVPHNYPSGADIMVCEPEGYVEFIDEEEYEGD